MTKTAITTFYRFLSLKSDRVQELRHAFEDLAATENLRGLVLLGDEGVNATISGPEAGLARLKLAVQNWLQTEIQFKDSFADRPPFHVFKVKIKNEIVSLGKTELVPSGAEDGHVTPAEWQKLMADPETTILDTRNRYEVEIGKFKGATDLALNEFNEFPEKLRDADLPKDKRVLIYCTGGIRCEKAILEMRRQGFQNVVQLQGGILNYLAKYPERDFEGECFVFDYRVALDQNLKPTQRFKLCPHCGQPASESLDCRQCGEPAMICPQCFAKADHHRTCSKNCAHHAAIGSNSAKTHLQERKKRSPL